MRRRLALGGLTVLLVLTGCTPTARETVKATADTPPVVTGYALAGSARPSDVTRDGDLVDTVGVDGVVLTGPAGLSAVDADMRALRDAATRAHRHSVLLVSNYSNRLGDFDEPGAHRMLASAANRATVARALVRRATGFSGVQIDLESLTRRDLVGLSAFTRAVRHALPASKSVSMAFMASGGGAGYLARGYDLTELGRVLDVAVLMSYDDHGPWSGAGPIAPLPWVRRELHYFLSRISRAKVDLGAAAYGYQWGGGSAEVTVPQARHVAGSRARWSPTYGEWYASVATTGGRHRTLWWDDARSVELRRQLAADQHLHGVAIWELGSSGSLRP